MVVKNKKSGFTLAEIMLTLSLIGILATLTVSTIGGSIQQRARQAEFRAAYAKMESALRSVTIEDGKIYRCYYRPQGNNKVEFGLKIAEGTTSVSKDCRTLEASLTKTLGSTKKCEKKPVTNKCVPNNYPEDSKYFQKDADDNRAYVLDNGMILWVSKAGIRIFAIDVNGRSAPNQWGQDLFPFEIKVTESKKIGDNIYPVSVGLLPLTTYSQPKVSASGKTTAQMMKESANYKK